MDSAYRNSVPIPKSHCSFYTCTLQTFHFTVELDQWGINQLPPYALHPGMHVFYLQFLLLFLREIIYHHNY